MQPVLKANGHPIKAVSLVFSVIKREWGKTVNRGREREREQGREREKKERKTNSRKERKKKRK